MDPLPAGGPIEAEATAILSADRGPACSIAAKYVVVKAADPAGPELHQ
jgi:hypothetical protein